MKKLISLIMSICMVITELPMVVYAANIAPEISLEEFSEQFSEMNEEYADEPVSNRIIVKSKRNINKFDSVDVVEGYDDLHIVQFDNSDSAEQALEHYENNEYIEYAEKDMIVSIAETENSLLSSYGDHLSWGSETIGVDDYFDYLDDMSALPQIVVGIIDTGIDLDHEFLKERIIETNYNNSSSGKANSENDDNGHGTHVAGIVVDNTSNNVKIEAFKCLNSEGRGALSDVCLAVNAATESNVNVINMSLGIRGKSDLLEDTINNAIDQGITVCVAAGNNGNYAYNYTPANIENCITVGAIDAYDEKPLWSNFGDPIDIYAPGSSIYSTYNDGGYETLSGTSMATPFVAAAAALLLSNNINLKPNEVRDSLVDNSRLIKEGFINKYDINILYIGNLNDFANVRTAQPVFSMEGGIYSESITVEITCDDTDAEIYYTINGTRASKDNGILYTEPIIIDEVTTLNASAYVEGKLRSLQTSAVYNIATTDPDENFEINEDGIITKYIGDNIYLTIPEKINNITVTGIGDSVFRIKPLKIIVLPDTLTYIGPNAFRSASSLISVFANNIQTIEKYAFYRCRNLTDIDFLNVEFVGEYAFESCERIESIYSEKLIEVDKRGFDACNGLIYLELPNAITLDDHSFSYCGNLEVAKLPNVETLGNAAFYFDGLLKEIDLANLKKIEGKETFYDAYSLETIYFPFLEGEIPEGAFSFCHSLKNLYIPKVKSIASNAFNNYTTMNAIFAPSLENAQSLPLCNDVNIYLSDKFVGTANPTYNYTIIAPNGSYAELWANDNNFTFIPSDYRDSTMDSPINVEDKGRSIRVTNAGLRFGFSWNEIPEIEKLASDIEYGFVYHYNYDNEPYGSDQLTIDNVGIDNIKKKEAVNLDDTIDNNIVFNLVFTNIPDENQNTNISVRAYVCIDGMYFYSNSLNGSFAEVSGKVLQDEEIDESIKITLKQILKSKV